MKARLAWSQRARSQLETLIRRRREYSEQSGRELRTQLLGAIDSLRNFPELGRETDIGPPPGTYRRLIVGQHIVIYRYVDDIVVLISVRHGRTME